MKCPACGLYHPAFYERCVACGVVFENASTAQAPNPESEAGVSNFGYSDRKAVKQSLTRIRFGPDQSLHQDQDEDTNRDQHSNQENNYRKPLAKIKLPNLANFKLIPTRVGILIGVVIACVCAGMTIFFLSKSPDDKHLLELGKNQLSLGQYAFAVETLSKATALRPDDPKAFLALARAYVGVDQVDQAWDCIVHAQQLGVGVVSEPALASELANYYRQRGQYDKAVDLLRPLANANVFGKRSELADMDALRGDECLEKGDLEQARRCWEEVQDLHEGSRFSEAQARLSTIYTKLANLAYSNHEEDKAIDYINKLNSIGENARNYLLAADIYERDNKLSEAIEQVRKALKLSENDQFTKSRLAELLSKQGKELIESGDDQSGYGYLEQAKSVDPAMRVPVVTLKKLVYKIDPVSKRPMLSGQVWNQSDKNVEALSLRAQLCDAKDRVLWTGDERLVDEFVPPLVAKESKSFSFLAPSSVKGENPLCFKVYVDGSYYASYPLKSIDQGGQKLGSNLELDDNKSTASENNDLNDQAENKKNSEHIMPTGQELKPASEPRAQRNWQPVKEPRESVSPEEKTIKDLEY